MEKCGRRGKGESGRHVFWIRDQGRDVDEVSDSRSAGNVLQGRTE